jgi:hypothetical protein
MRGMTKLRALLATLALAAAAVGVGVVTNSDRADAAGWWVQCNSTSGSPYVSATGYSSSTTNAAAVNCFVRLGEARWGYGCATVSGTWTDPVTQVRYGTVSRKSVCGGYASFSARGTRFG